MDFDLAAKRLDRDHSRLKRDAAERKGAGPGGGGTRSGGGMELSARARREAEELQRQARRKAEEKQAMIRERDHQLEFVRQCERALKVRGLVASSSANGGSGTGFLPTSIYGDGDKLALPPSVLEHLSSIMTENSSPWTFRVGILNPDYAFPASPFVQAMKPLPLQGSMDEDEDDIDEDSDDDDYDETSRNAQSAAYLDELRHKYLAYTHGTVVEFTQEEGQVGLPRAIASALIAQMKNKNVAARVKRTVDPATINTHKNKNNNSNNNNNPTEMDVDVDVDVDTNGAGDSDADEERTAGHLAWGAFDIPDMPVEVSLVELPKGKACTLAPTPQAVANGFYNLADVKLVLEQSLIRTRATLTVGDLVQTWNRGVQYDLHVTSVLPSTYNAVVCINTDIEVDFVPVPSAGVPDASQATKLQSAVSRAGGGRTLMDSEPHSALTSLSPSSPGTGSPKRKLASLRPEPPADQVEGICVIQVRLDQLSAKRRFDVREAHVLDLYDFAASALLSSADGDVPRFRLVTRYPRRVIERPASAGTDANRTLEEAGIKTGQELLIVERL